MEDQAPHDLIVRWRSGDEQALKDLLPTVERDWTMARTWLSHEQRHAESR
jgi:hypothetical protein